MIDIVTAEFITQRRILEQYIDTHPEFLPALEPVTLLPDAPFIKITDVEFTDGEAILDFETLPRK